MGKISLILGLASLCFCASSTYGAETLQSYNVDTSSITVSGLSSGGAMAMQFHVAFSSEIQGAGILAGLPYACGKGGLTSATLCMNSPTTINVGNLIAEINTQANANKIDATSNLNGDKVYIFHGTKDTTVNPNSGKKVEDVYDAFGTVFQTEYSLGAVHGYPTDFYGAACGSSSAGTHYINNCDYHGAFITINYLLGNTLNLTSTPGKPLAGELIEFNQAEFGASQLINSMDANGYVYIPIGCADRQTKCKLHIAFHGCQQSKGNLQDIYATKTGYLEVAEENNIIVLFPQAAANMLIGNPNACWDWWGYLNANFLNKDGGQMKAVHQMMLRVADCDASGCDPTVTDPPPEPTSERPIETSSRQPGDCNDNDVSFHPVPGNCQLYSACACGASVLLECAQGLYFDPAISKCNFMQLVPGCD